jgi:hypothetical protein
VDRSNHKQTSLEHKELISSFICDDYSLVIGFSVTIFVHLRDGMSINMHALWLHDVLIWCYLPADGMHGEDNI